MCYARFDSLNTPRYSIPLQRPFATRLRGACAKNPNALPSRRPHQTGTGRSNQHCTQLSGDSHSYLDAARTAKTQIHSPTMGSVNPGKLPKSAHDKAAAADADVATASSSRHSSSEPPPPADAAAAASATRTSVFDQPPTQSVYEFRPFQLQKIDYKAYDGHFDQGINMYPRPRSGHRIVCCGGGNESDIFLFGGFNPALAGGAGRTESPMFKEFWCYNAFTRKWLPVLGARDQLPAEQASHAMCAWGRAVVIYGGTGFPFGEQLSNHVHLVHPARQPRPTIERLATSGPAPLPAYGQSICVQADSLYVVGGTNGFAYTFDVHRLDLRTRRWHCLYEYAFGVHQPDEQGRYRHEIFADAEHIYSLGGGTAFGTYDIDAVQAFGLAERRWRDVPTLADAVHGRPHRRKCHSCVAYRNDAGELEVVVAGGSYENERGRLLALRDTWRLNLHTRRWTAMVTMEFPRQLYFHDAAYSSAGLMYVFGGIERVRSGAQANGGDNSQRTNRLYRVWVRLPRLSEMCWEALVALWPAVVKTEAGRLLELGVPRRMVERLPGAEQRRRRDPTEEMFDVEEEEEEEEDVGDEGEEAVEENAAQAGEGQDDADDDDEELEFFDA